MPYKNDSIENNENNEEKSSKNRLRLSLLISSAVIGALALVFCLVLNFADTNETAYKAFAGLSIAMPLVAIAISALCIVKRDKKTYALILPIIIITCCAMVFAGGIYGSVTKNPTDPDKETVDSVLKPGMSFEEIRTALTDIKNFTVTENDHARRFRENGISYSTGTNMTANFYEGTRYYSISVGGGEDAIKIVDYSGYSYDFSDIGVYTALEVLDGWEAQQEDISVTDDGELVFTRGEITRKMSRFNTTEFDIPSKFKNYYKTMSATNPVLKTQAITGDTCAVIGAESYVTAIEIPELIDGKAVVKIVDNAFTGHTKLTSVKISNSITTLGISAFSDCTKLSSVTFGNNCQLTSISEGAFYGCTALKNITIPSGITTVKSTAFCGCTGLTSVVLPNSIAYVETGAFNSSGLTSMTIPSGVKSIDNVTFGYCSELESVTIPKSVTEIGSMAFVDCGKLTAIYYDGTEGDWNKVKKDLGWDDNAGDYLVYFVPETGQLSYAMRSQGDGYVVTGIGDHSGSELVIPETRNGKPIIGINDSAFADCSELMNVTIPSGVTSIGTDAFKNCFKLIEVCNKSQLWIEKGSEEHGGVAYYAKNVYEEGEESRLSTDGNGFIIYEDVNEKVLVDYVGTAKDITLPSGVTSIYDYAFYNRTDLTNVTISSDVVSIGGYAFSGCSGLTTVTIPDSVTRIGVTAFSNCVRLADVTIGSGVTYIGYKAFDGCVKLIEVYNKSALKLTVGSSDNGEVAYYAKNVYTTAGGNKLSTDDNGYVIYSDGAGNILIGYRGSETVLTLPDGITKIYTYAFYSDAKTESITIPDSVASIGSYAFALCGRLTTINFNGTLAQWNQVNKELDWDEGTDNYTIGYKDLAYELNAEKTAYTVIGIGTYEGTEITIPATYANLPVTTIKDSAFEDNTTITSVSIADSVTSIGESAFDGCTGLTSIAGPANVVRSVIDQACPLSYSVTIAGTTSIGNCAFEGCTGLTSVTIGDSVTNIGSFAFRDCSGLTNITIPDNVTSIGDWTFDGCSGLTRVTFGKNSRLTSIGGSTFEGCTKLTSITIPDSVTSIGSFAFRDCIGLTNITIPDSVTSIGDFAFDGCSGLTRVTFGKNSRLTSIGGSTFEGCTKLTSITIPDSVTSIGSFAFRDCSELTSVTIGGSVTSIGDWTFDGCTGLTSITGPPNVVRSVIDQACPLSYSVTITGATSIGNCAFEGCTGLTSVTIGDSVTNIDSFAFRDCSELTSVTIGDSVTSIGNFAFDGCSGLTSVTFGENSRLTSIGGSTFEGCTKLTSITIPDSVTSIGSFAFRDCSELTSVTIGGSVTSIGDWTFDGCTGLTSITGPPNVVRSVIDQACPLSYSVTINGTTSIGYAAFEGCTGLTSVTIGDSVTSIDLSAFRNCTGLTSITIPDSVTSIDNYAFYGCSGLTNITIPDSVTSIGYAAFDGTAWYNNQPNGLVYAGKVAYKYKGSMPNNTTIVLKDGTLGIGNYAFYGCSGLTNITIPDSVTSIGYKAFDGTAWYANQPNGLVYAGKVAYEYKGSMPNNTTIVLKDGTLGIGSSAFEGCTGLTSVTIPDSVTSIGNDAFYGCSGLTNITIPDSVTSIGKYAFDGCTGLTSVTIPDSVTSIGYAAFEGCSGLTNITIPDSVTSIGDYAFFCCTKLTSITIPDSVTSIGNYVFYGCSGLTSVTIPDSVTSIGNDAFCCSGLTNITIPDSVTSIGWSAFYGCTKLTSITFEDTTTWYRTESYSDWKNKTGGTQISITNASQNATYFTDSYYDYYWYKL